MLCTYIIDAICFPLIFCIWVNYPASPFMYPFNFAMHYFMLCYSFSLRILKFLLLHHTFLYVSLLFRPLSLTNWLEIWISWKLKITLLHHWKLANVYPNFWPYVYLVLIWLATSNLSPIFQIPIFTLKLRLFSLKFMSFILSLFAVPIFYTCDFFVPFLLSSV